MPHMCKRKPSTETYYDYIEETTERVLKDVPRLGVKGAHRAHGISCGMLYNKYHGKDTQWHTIIVFHVKRHVKNNCSVTILCIGSNFLSLPMII